MKWMDGARFFFLDTIRGVARRLDGGEGDKGPMPHTMRRTDWDTSTGDLGTY